MKISASSPLHRLSCQPPRLCPGLPLLLPTTSDRPPRWGGASYPPTSTRSGCQERHSLPTHHNSPSSLLRNPSRPVKRTQPFLKFSISSRPGWQAGIIKATQFVRWPAWKDAQSHWLPLYFFSADWVLNISKKETGANSHLLLLSASPLSEFSNVSPKALSQ